MVCQNWKIISDYFTRHRLPYQPYITLNNKDIPWKRSVKYLGGILDQKLSWEEQINSIMKKGEQSLKIIKFSTKTGKQILISVSFSTRHMFD